MPKTQSVSEAFTAKGTRLTTKKDKFGTYFNMMEPEMVDNMYYIDFSKIDRAALGKKLLRVQAGQ